MNAVPGIFIFFLAGIMAASGGWTLACAVVATAGILIVIIFQFRRVVALFFGAAILGAGYCNAYLWYATAHLHLPFDQKNAVIRAIISDEPNVTDKFEVMEARTISPFSGTIMILAPPDRGINYGDMVRVEGSVKRPDEPGGLAIIFPKKISLIAAHKGSRLREALIGMKLAILSKFREVLPEDEAALLGGITFGSKQDFSPAMKTDMALAGLTHMVAISGYNITIIILAAGALFGSIFPRRATFALTVALIVIFILMSGIQASAIRAAIMGFIALLAKELGRSYDIGASIAFAAFAMALQSPLILLNDAGFQLSFLSLMGVVYVEKPLKKLLQLNDEGFLGWKTSACTTFSAQLAVLPVLIGTFGVFSLTSIGANILVLGTVPLTMFFGTALAILAFVSAPLALLTGKIAGLFLGYQLGVIKLFALLAVPLPITFGSFPAFTAYYSLLIAFIYIYGDPYAS